MDTRSTQQFSLIVDPSVDGLNTAFWKTVSGSPSVSSGRYRLNAAELVSYPQFQEGEFEFVINVPTTPTAGGTRSWGLRGQGPGNRGAVIFDIASQVFSAKVYDKNGTLVASRTIPWVSGWEGAATRYYIRWGRNGYQFKVVSSSGDSDLVDIQTVVALAAHLPMPLSVKNVTADNMDVSFISMVDVTNGQSVATIAGSSSGSSSTSSNAASSTTAGTVSATLLIGGTTIIAANASRRFAQCQNNGAADVYYGAGTVTSSFPKVVPGGTFTWHSTEALKVLSSSGSCDIAYIDYTN